MISKENKSMEDFKYLIDSRNLTDKEKVEDREAIVKARAERFGKRTDNEIKTARLMQLKFQMEEYLSSPLGSSVPSFPKFLITYIDTLYDKRKDFASDISIKPIVLSHILNEHREPNESFILRLMLHSQDSFKDLFNFDKELWAMAYYQDKVCRFLGSSEKWVKSERKHVKGKTITI
tara:strand:+ start:14564 stop:15094 length:531 start_codon:yes stop_codon:yes gene_type:complete